MSGLARAKFSIMPLVSWRLPATSSTFSVTGSLGLAGTSPAFAPSVSVDGALHADRARTIATAPPVSVLRASRIRLMLISIPGRVPSH